MNFSSNLAQIMWLAFIVLFAILQIMAAVMLFRERSGATWMMLIGSILSGGFNLGTRILYELSDLGFLDLKMETLTQYYSIMTTIAAFGGLLFLAGLIFYARRRRALSARIAELEQIIAAQNSRVQ